jgi:RNA polymerase sigma-54 factor
VKPTLQLKQGQQLSMTPQLQQAIRLLQLSALELQQEIQAVLDSNVMLEVEEPGTSDEEFTSPDDENSMPVSHEGQESVSSSDQVTSEAIPEDMPVDTEWEDIYPDAPVSEIRSSDEGEDGGQGSQDAAPESLQDHLLWQLNLTPMSDRDRLIAMAIIDAVEPGGFLNQTIVEIGDGLRARWSTFFQSTQDADVPEQDEVLAVLHRLQQFDPPGVAAQDLRDCLLIQLHQLHADIPWLADAREVVTHHLDLLAAHDFKTLIRKSGIRENTLREAVKLIQSLNPQPGSAMMAERTEYVIPDVYVRKKDGRWRVELNPDCAPRLRINETYAALIKRADTSRDNTLLKDHMQEARWFLKSLETRNETLLKVASTIVQHQRAFLEYGEEAMKPLVLHDIADSIEMHESTVSRITSNKYLHTPRGVFELKYFFSSHVATTAGGECSSTAIRALIKKLVSAENPGKPYSDSQLATLLEAKGIQVARRTIAKYREALGIAPSSERKHLG